MCTFWFSTDVVNLKTNTLHLANISMLSRLKYNISYVQIDIYCYFQWFGSTPQLSYLHVYQHTYHTCYYVANTWLFLPLVYFSLFYLCLRRCTSFHDQSFRSTTDSPLVILLITFSFIFYVHIILSYFILFYLILSYFYLIFILFYLIWW